MYKSIIDDSEILQNISQVVRSIRRESRAWKMQPIWDNPDAFREPIPKRGIFNKEKVAAQSSLSCKGAYTFPTVTQRINSLIREAKVT